MKLMWFHLMPYTELPDDFREKHPVGVGRHPFLAVRPAARASHVQRLHGRARIRRRMRLRRGLRQRAPLERLRADAVAQPDRLVAGAAHHRHRDLRDGQLARALQPADPGGRRIRDDRRDLGRAADRRLPGRHADGHLLRLWPEPVDAARALSRSARPRDARLDRSRTPSPSTAASTSSATSTSGRARCRSRTRRSGSRAAARSRPGSGARRWTTSTPTCPISATRTARRRCTGFWDEMERLGKDRNPYRAGFLQFVGVAESREKAMRALPRAGRVFLWPLPARRSALGDAARLYHRGDAARRHPGPGRPRRQPRRPAEGARDDARWRTSSSAAM